MELLSNNPSMQDLIEKLNEVIGSLNNNLSSTNSEIAEVKELVNFGSDVLASRLNAKLWYFKTQEFMKASTELCEGDSCFILNPGGNTGEGTFEYWYIYKTDDVGEILDSYIELSNPDLVGVKIQELTFKALLSKFDSIKKFSFLDLVTTATETNPGKALDAIVGKLLADRIGNLKELPTADKNSLVGAIKEIKTVVEDNYSENTRKIESKAERTELQTETSERKQEIAVERARINNLTQLSEGSTTGDAELQDIRVGADSKVYDTAGEAVRGQVSELKEDLENIRERTNQLFDYSNKSNRRNWNFGDINSIGVSSSCITYIIPVDVADESHITVHRNVLSSRFALGTSDKSEPTISDVPLLKIVVANNSYTATIPVTSDVKSLLIYAYNDEQTYTEDEIFGGMMVQFGDVFTGYEEYYNPKGKGEILERLDKIDGNFKFRYLADRIGDTNSSVFIDITTEITAGTSIFAKLLGVNHATLLEYQVYGKKADGSYTKIYKGTEINKLVTAKAETDYIAIRLRAVYIEPTDAVSADWVFIAGDNSILGYIASNTEAIASNTEAIGAHIVTDTAVSNANSIFRDYSVEISSGDYVVINAISIQNFELTQIEVYGFYSDGTYKKLLDAKKLGFYTIKIDESFVRLRIRAPISNVTGDTVSFTYMLSISGYDSLSANVATLYGQTNSIQQELTQKTGLRTCNIFRKVVCCGDSYTAGYIVDASGTVHNVNEDYAWPHYMETITGNTWVNCGHSGANAHTWLTLDRGLPKAQASGKAQAYIVGLMINDSSSDTSRNLNLGSADDIGTDTVSYYGCYSRVIRELFAISPNAKVFIETCPKVEGDRYIPYNQAIHDIYAAYKENYPGLHLLDLFENYEMYTNASLTADSLAGHYTAIGYEQFAEILSVILSRYINEHITEFQDVAFIEYD